MKNFLKGKWNDGNVGIKIGVVAIISMILFFGYKGIFASDNNVSNKSTNYSQENKGSVWDTITESPEEEVFRTQKDEFIEVLDMLVATENLGYFNIQWALPDRHTMVVTLDIDNAARTHNITAVQTYDVVREMKDNFGYYLQLFNKKFHKGNANEGELTLIIQNKRGQEIARTQKLVKTQLTK